MLFKLFALSVFYTEVLSSNHNLLKQNLFEINNAEDIFAQFVKTYEKDYDVIEYRKRLDIFSDTLVNLNNWNAENPGLYSLNEFSDLTFDEFSQTYLGFNGNVSVQPIDDSLYDSGERSEVPEQFDWRDRGVVSTPKNQLHCQACYIFSAIANIESQHAIKHQIKALDLSEQQALDCGNSSCSGGWMHDVFYNLAKRGGSMREEDYPYTGKKMQCKIKKDKIAVKVNPTKLVGMTDEESMKNMVYKIGPLSIGMEFTSKMVHATPGEIMIPTDCNSSMNHAVLIVGYGREKDIDYWIIKNSWGTSWGDGGFIKLQRGAGACSIGQYVAVSDVE